MNTMEIKIFKIYENGKWNSYQLPHSITINNPAEIVFPFILLTDLIEGIKDDFNIKTVEEYAQEYDKYPDDDLFGYVLPFQFRDIMDAPSEIYTDIAKRTAIIERLIHHYNFPIIESKEDE